MGYSNKKVLLLLLSLSLLSSCISLECVTYLSAENKETKKTIPKEYINDNYCDCPYTGEDEPNTSACSGSIQWSIKSSSDSDSDSEENKEIYYQCPKQKNVQISKSKINDNICDCCDGSDEENNNNKNKKCIDNCDIILEEERKKQNEIKNEYIIGYNQYKTIISKYNNYIQETKHKKNN